VIVVLREIDVGVDSVRVAPWQRAVARLLAIRLDSMLAAGISPESSTLLGVRALQLVSTQHRDLAARSMRRIIAEAMSERARARNGLPVNWAAVRVARTELCDLCDALEAPVPVPARGVALANELLTDGAGPLFHPARAHELTMAALHAVDALDPMSGW